MAKSCNDCVHAIVSFGKIKGRIDLDTNIFTDSSVRRVYCRQGQWKTFGGQPRFFVSMLAFTSSGIEKTAQKCEFFEKDVNP